MLVDLQNSNENYKDKMIIKENEIYTFKLASGEEMVAKVIKISDQYIDISEPVSIAPNQQGLGMVPSLFTSEIAGEFKLNTNSVSMYAETNDQIKVKYIEATTGIKIPEKKILVG
jgi:hypothetical protein